MPSVVKPGEQPAVRRPGSGMGGSGRSGGARVGRGASRLVENGLEAQELVSAVVEPVAGTLGQQLPQLWQDVRRAAVDAKDILTRDTTTADVDFVHRAFNHLD